MTSPISGESINAPNDGSYFRRRKRHRRGASSEDLKQLSSYDSKIHKRRRRPGDAESNKYKSNLIVFTSLLAVLLVYAGILVISLGLKKFRKPESATPPAPAAAETVITATPVSHAFSPSEISGLIKTWKTSTELVGEGTKLLDRENISRAETRLFQALESNPENTALHTALAEIYINKQNYSNALDSIVKVLNHEPGNLHARLRLAQTLANEGNHQGALIAANWLLEQEPFSLEANRIAANASLNQNLPGDAIGPLKKIASLDPGDIKSKNNLAVAHSRLGQYDKALEVLEELLRGNTSDSVTFYNLAVCYAQQGKAEASVQAIRQASLQFGGNFVRAWLDSNDFDPIRNNLDFQALVRNAGNPQASDAPAPGPVASGSQHPASTATNPNKGKAPLDSLELPPSYLTGEGGGLD